MGRVIAYAEGVVDEVGDPLGCPDLASIAIRLSPWSEERRQLRHLVDRQFQGRSRRFLSPQRLHASLTRTAHPLAHRSWSDSERSGNVLLFPAQVFQFPGTSSSSFAPLERCCLLIHVILSHTLTCCYSGRERY